MIRHPYLTTAVLFFVSAAITGFASRISYVLAHAIFDFALR